MCVKICTPKKTLLELSSALTLSRKFSSSRWVLVTLLEEESDHVT